MGGMREHIDGLYGYHPVVGIHIMQVACLGGRVTRHIDDTLRGGAQDGLHHVGMHASTWWVGDDHIWATVLFDERIGEDILHVTGIEQGVVDAVDLTVDLRIFDGLGHIFDTDHLTGFAGYEVGDGAGAGVEVVDLRFEVGGLRFEV